MRVMKVIMGLTGFLVFLFLTILVAVAEVVFFIPWLLLILINRKFSTRYTWTYATKSFRIANYCYDWSEFPD